MTRLTEQEIAKCRAKLITKMNRFGNEVCEDLDMWWSDDYAVNMADAALTVLKAMNETQYFLQEQGHLKDN